MTDPTTAEVERLVTVAQEALQPFMGPPSKDVTAVVTHISDEELYAIVTAILSARQPEAGLREAPALLSKDEAKEMLTEAETLWRDLQANELGGYSGNNRPFWIMAEFKRVIEKYGNRDVGLTWTKDQLDGLATHEAPPSAPGWEEAIEAAAIGTRGFYVGTEGDMCLAATVVGHVEGWLELEMSDASRSVCRPSRFQALINGAKP